MLEIEPSLELTGVTLAFIAGGLGTRMGKPKAWLRVGERPILDWMLDRLQWPGPTMLVTAPAVPAPPAEERFDQHVVDPEDGVGPLRGVLTALQNSTTTIVMTIAVDMPLVETRQLAWLASSLARRPECLGVMGEASVNGERQIEPFPAAYRIEAADFLSAQLQTGQRSVHRLCRDPRFSVQPVPADWRAEVWTNLNDPLQFAEFENAMSKPRKPIPEISQ